MRRTLLVLHDGQPAVVVDDDPYDATYALEAYALDVKELSFGALDVVPDPSRPGKTAERAERTPHLLLAPRRSPRYFHTIGDRIEELDAGLYEPCEDDDEASRVSPAAATRRWDSGARPSDDRSDGDPAIVASPCGAVCSGLDAKTTTECPATPYADDRPRGGPDDRSGSRDEATAETRTTVRALKPS